LVSESQMSAATKKASRILFFLYSLFALGVAYLGMLIAKAVATPVLELRDQAEKLGQGDYRTRIKIANGGIVSDLANIVDNARINIYAYIKQVEKFRKLEKQKAQERIQQLRASLSQIIPTRFVEMILEDPLILGAPPRTEVITIMFVDMVGFSRITENKDPDEVFHRSKVALDRLRASIVKYNGVIDRSLGDGILCFFGYRYDDRLRENHAQNALKCALEIQQQSCQNMVESGHKHITFAYRIGINTSLVSIGNMGSSTNPDFTVAGQGVVMTSRFESSCDPYMILIGASTYSNLGKSYDKSNIKEKYIQIKHSSELVKCYEVNPFVENELYLYRAKKLFYDHLRVKMTNPRFKAVSEDLTMKIDGHEIKIINFSSAGFGVLSEIYWGRNVVLNASLTAKNPELKDTLERYQLHSFRIAVRWSTMINFEKYRHGVETFTLNVEQIGKLFSICQDVLGDGSKVSEDAS